MNNIVTFSAGSIDLNTQPVPSLPEGMSEDRARELLQGTAIGRDVLFNGKREENVEEHAKSVVKEFLTTADTPTVAKFDCAMHDDYEQSAMMHKEAAKEAKQMAIASGEGQASEFERQAYKHEELARQYEYMAAHSIVEDKMEGGR